MEEAAEPNLLYFLRLPLQLAPTELHPSNHGTHPQQGLERPAVVVCMVIHIPLTDTKIESSGDRM